jgi:endonuclease/exonuclease/phosphatase family metal-dependent hydrolase
MGGAVRPGTAELELVKNSNMENRPAPAPALKCFFVNARGLISKIEILKNYVDKLKLDIIGIAETFLNDEVMQAEISIDGYCMYRKDRGNFKEGKAGGVILYIKNEIVSYECTDLNRMESESVWCKIKVNGNTSLTVGVCYRSQAASEKELSELFKSIEIASKGQTIIMGDFNYPKINWDTLECDSMGTKFRDLLLDNYLYQHVKESTRESNTLDLVISSDVNMVTEVEVLDHLGNSDHNIIVWNLVCNVHVGKSKVPYRQYHKADYAAMREWLSKIDWDIELSNLEVDEIWSKFCHFIEKAIDQFVPLGHSKSKKAPKWMNRNAKAAMKYKSRMWLRYRQSKSYNDMVEYKIAQRKAVKEYKKAKKQFERKLAKDIKINPKSFYAYVRSKSKVKDSVGPLRDSDGQLVSEKEKMCNLLNEYFGSVFTTENSVNELPEVKCFFNEDKSHMLSNIVLTRDIISIKLSKLKVNKAPGIDGIVPRLLVETADILNLPLLYVYQKSMESGRVPDDWKKANVTAIFKKGDKSSPCNYRPVSLTSVVCKVLESLIRDNIVEHVRKFNLIRETQHGFVKKKSCLTNLLEFLEFVSDYVDQGYPIDVVYLDFQKAFDKVPHKRLMSKIKALGIIGNIYNWIEDWLKDRVQRVVLLGNSSKWEKGEKWGAPRICAWSSSVSYIYK